MTDQSACATCRSTLRPGARFCPTCGAPAVVAPQTIEPTATPPAAAPASVPAAAPAAAPQVPHPGALSAGVKAAIAAAVVVGALVIVGGASAGFLMWRNSRHPVAAAAVPATATVPADSAPAGSDAAGDPGEEVTARTSYDDLGAAYADVKVRATGASALAARYGNDIGGSASTRQALLEALTVAIGDTNKARAGLDSIPVVPEYEPDRERIDKLYDLTVARLAVLATATNGALSGEEGYDSVILAARDSSGHNRSLAEYQRLLASAAPHASK